MPGPRTASATSEITFLLILFTIFFSLEACSDLSKTTAQVSSLHGENIVHGTSYDSTRVEKPSATLTNCTAIPDPLADHSDAPFNDRSDVKGLADLGIVVDFTLEGECGRAGSHLNAAYFDKTFRSSSCEPIERNTQCLHRG
jgi:hypothetical protein